MGPYSGSCHPRSHFLWSLSLHTSVRALSLFKQTKIKAGSSRGRGWHLWPPPVSIHVNIHMWKDAHMPYTHSNNKEPVSTSISSSLCLSLFLANEYTAPWLKRDRKLLHGEQQRLTGLPRPRYPTAERLRLFHLWNNVLKILLALTTHWLSAKCLE